MQHLCSGSLAGTAPFPGRSRHVKDPAERLECPQGNLNTGVAWLSSARVVRRRVKSFNERNPYLMLHYS